MSRITFYSKDFMKTNDSDFKKHWTLGRLGSCSTTEISFL